MSGFEKIVAIGKKKPGESRAVMVRGIMPAPVVICRMALRLTGLRALWNQRITRNVGPRKRRAAGHGP